MATESGISFELFAPYNERVALLGSWNEFQPIEMQKDDRGVWRTEVTLPDGDYSYLFEVTSLSYFAQGQPKQIADPKAIRITDEAQEKAMLTVRNGERRLTSYEWQYDHVPLPRNHDLIIYELHIGDFVGGPGDISGEGRLGSFQDAIDKLDYIAALGINAVELMPVNEFPGMNYWGYSLRNLYAVENRYGTPEDLCRLVDECHARGIRVLLDGVYNHMDPDAPLAQIDYTYWFYGDNPDGPELDFGPKFNFEHFDENLQLFPARDYVINAMRSFINTYHFDGVRFDATKALKYFDLLEWFSEQLHQDNYMKPFITIAEHIPQDPAVAGANGPMDAAWHHNFAKQIQCTVVGSPKDGRNPFDTQGVINVLDARRDGFHSVYNAVQYITSHDEDRIMWQVGEYGKTFGEAAFRRVKLGAALMLLAPGIPMLYMGQEFGEVSPRTDQRQPLDWALLANDDNRALHNFYQHLIRLRLDNPALRSDNLEVVADMAERGIFAFKRWNDSGNIVLVLVNLYDHHAGDVQFSSPALIDGDWHEAIYRYDIHVSNQHFSDSLGASEVKVYFKK